MSWTPPVKELGQFYYCGWLCSLLEEEGTGRRFVSYPPELRDGLACHYRRRCPNGCAKQRNGVIAPSRK